MTLTIGHEPTRILHDGRYVRLSELQAGIMAKLIERGKAPFYILHNNRESLKVIMSSIRAKLPAGITIRAIRDWGYELSERNN